MTRAEIKEWAKKKLKENFWPICGTTVVASILTNLSFQTSNSSGYGDYTYTTTYSFGWILYFVSVGLAYYLVKLINNENAEFKDLFHFASDFLRCLGACLLQIIFIFLWMLLLIIPGIIKALGYALVPYLLADEKYKDMKVTDVLKKSQEMMNGHKMDYFIFGLSFIPWVLLGIITLGIGLLYVIPYYSLAQARFLNNIKLDAEGNNGGNNTKVSKENVKYCPQCGKELQKDATFCSDCGTKM